MSLLLGGIGFVLTLAGFVTWALRTVAGHVDEIVVRFPAPTGNDD